MVILLFVHKKKEEKTVETIRARVKFSMKQFIWNMANANGRRKRLVEVMTRL